MPCVPKFPKLEKSTKGKPPPIGLLFVPEVGVFVEVPE